MAIMLTIVIEKSHCSITIISYCFKFLSNAIRIGNVSKSLIGINWLLRAKHFVHNLC